MIQECKKYKHSKEQLYRKLNDELKKAKTGKDLQAILERVESETEYPLYLIMKRSGKVATDFIINHSRADYILDDGCSTRSSKISNLHRNLRIGE